MASLGFSVVVVVGAPTMALAVGLLSWEMRRALAPWVGWLGLVCALALLFAVFRFPLMALPVWTIAHQHRAATQQGARARLIDSGWP
jgi:hypothetical protein